MQSSNIPTKIPLPFAYNAGVGYKNTIPTASQIGVVNGRASLNDGFPPLNFVPISSGGVPPFGSDVNGILNEITAITQWQQAGGFFFYDSSFSTTIGGYPKGAILQSSSNSGLWISTAENNTTNPDTGGAGWTSLAFEGSQAITVTTADVTVTQLQSAYPVLIISGALTGARSLILPAVVGQWIVQNNTTGAFNLTVKTASGTGVVATQSQSTYIYGDGTNILFADSSKVASFNGRVGVVTLNATDVTTALGYTPIGPNLTGAVTSVGNATSLGSFSSAQLAGALTDETGTGVAVFSASPALTGFPTAPTASAGTNTTQIATTAFVQSAVLPSGTRMPFAQAAAPTGWTQDTSSNADNRMLRVVSSAGNGVGGSDSPILNNTTMVSHTHTFTGNALAAHTHTDSGHSHTWLLGPSGAGAGGITGAGNTTTNTGTSYANISSVSAGTPSGTNSTTSGVGWTPRYIDMIICAKN
jgi:hypothetical protein